MSTQDRMLKLLKPHKLQITLILLGLTVATGLGSVNPYLTKLVIDKVVNGGQYHLLKTYAPLIVLSVFAKGAVQILIGYSRESLGQKIIRNLKQQLYDHLQSLSMQYYVKAQTGQLMSRFTSDAEQTRVFLAFACIDLFSSTLTFIWIFLLLFRMNWSLTLVCLSFMPFLVWEVLNFHKRIRKAWTAIHQQMAVLNTRLQESVTGIRVVKAFAREPYESRRFSLENKRNYVNQMKATRISSRANPYMDLLGGLSWVILLWYGGYLTIKGSISIGTLIAFNGYLWSLIWPIRQMGWIVNTFGQASTAAERIFQIFDTKPLIRDKTDAIKTEISGHVRFDDVSFKYGDTRILRNISFEARPGQVVAIVGRTGAGKSTVMNMVSRFLDPSSGNVYIDGLNVRDMDAAAMRRQIGVVFQETFLFSDTLRNNITYGNPDCTEDDLIKSTKWAEAYDFISQLEDGYETPVGERGVGLSGGQKQRVALARAFLKNPKILILDDATSSLDMATEFRIFAALKELMRNRTTFIIAQRLITVKSADMILVMDKGEIVERGTHEELLRTGGLYSSIFNEQFRKQGSEGAEVAAGGQ